MNYVDLHLHLDGAITADIARKLARIQGIDIPDSDEELNKLLTVPVGCTSLNDFLQCFAFPGSLLQTGEGIAEAVYLVSENIRQQGVIYAEFRFAPQYHTSQGLNQEDVIQAALDGLKKCKLKVNLILCIMRGQGNKAANEETLRLAKKYLVEDGGVVAIDLAGAEALFPVGDYASYFTRAKEWGIPYTIHAGEAAGADSVAGALELGTRRIGHGVRANEDPAVLEQIRREGIFLEMCPTSNRQTCAIADMSQYPLVDYLRRGIRVTLNTDDMGIEGTTLAEEFRLMMDEYGLTESEARQLVLNGIEAAFTTDSVKQELSKVLQAEP